MRPFLPSHLYLQIRNEIARRVARGDYPPGSLLPSEVVLAGEMHVSVGTIRKAVEMLHEEKLVNRSQGRGTIVADRRSEDFRGKLDRIRNADGSLIPWTIVEVEREVREADDSEQSMLRLGKSRPIISIRRRREADGAVVKVEHSRLPADLFGDIGDLDASEVTVENLSFLRGVLISSSDERLTLTTAPDGLAEQFGIPAEVTIVRLDRIVTGGDSVPLEWRIAYCHLGDRQYHAASTMGKPGRQA